MTAKSITLALAATTAAAALADVVEVKFTVKTVNDQDKVANKVISGLYDSENDTHVFWTVEKRTNEKGKTYNANVAYTGTYFGFTQATDNETYDTAGTFAAKAKQYGQNAELIWGDAANPENVLVAGAWGSANSKSGQAAGILDGKPATGTWSAKVNTKKMTLEQLLEKYKVEDYDLENQRESGVIADLDEEVKKAFETIAANEAKIQEQKDTITAKNTEIDGLNGQITDLNNDLSLTNAALAKAYAVIDKYIADLAATNATLAAQAEALKNAEAELATFEASIKGLNDSNLSNMLSDYLEKTAKEAKETRDNAQAQITKIEDAYTAYTNALDLTSASNTVLAAQAAYDTTNGLYKAAVARVEALTYTNDMVKIIFDEDLKSLDDWYKDQTNTVGDLIKNKKNEIAKAQEGFVAYTNELQVWVDAYKKVIEKEGGYFDLEVKAHTEYDEATNKVAAAQAAVDSFPKTLDAFKKAYAGELLTLDQFIEAKGKEEPPVTYTDDLAVQTAYNQYCQQEMKAKSGSLDKGLEDAKTEATTKRNAWDGGSVDEHGLAAGGALKKLQDTQKLLKDTQDKLDEAVEISDFNDDFTQKLVQKWLKGTIEKLNGELADLEQQLTDLEKEYAFWKDFATTCTLTDKEALAKALTDAESAKSTLMTDEGKASATLTEAKNAYDEQVTDQAAKLKNLALLICTKEDPAGSGIIVADEDGLNDLAGNVEAIRAKVDEYLNAPLGLEPDPTAEKPEVGSLNWMVAAAQRQIDAVARIRESLGISVD